MKKNSVFFAVIKFLVVLTLFCSIIIVQAATEQKGGEGGIHFTPLGSPIKMDKDWKNKMIHYDKKWSKGADLAFFILGEIMIDREEIEIRDHAHLMDAEGKHDFKPKCSEIREILEREGFIAKNIYITYDDFQFLWCWSCDIVEK